MTAKIEKNIIQLNTNSFKQKLKKTIFSQIYCNEKLFDDKQLKPIKLISSKNKNAYSKTGNRIYFELNILDSHADVYLYLNGSKSDMFYSIPTGRYCFNVYLDNEKNEIEMYYLLNSCKSPSVFKTIVRK